MRFTTFLSIATGSPATMRQRTSWTERSDLGPPAGHRDPEERGERQNRLLDRQGPRVPQVRMAGGGLPLLSFARATSRKRPGKDLSETASRESSLGQERDRDRRPPAQSGLPRVPRERVEEVLLDRRPCGRRFDRASGRSERKAARDSVKEGLEGEGMNTASEPGGGSCRRPPRVPRYG